MPNLPPDWQNKVVNEASGQANAALDAFESAFNDLSSKWSRYVADISRGILVVVVGGLAGGLVLSLVRRNEWCGWKCKPG